MIIVIGLLVIWAIYAIDTRVREDEKRDESGGKS